MSNLKSEYLVDDNDEEFRKSIQNIDGVGKNDLKQFLKDPRAIRYIQERFAAFMRTFKTTPEQNPL